LSLTTLTERAPVRMRKWMMYDDVPLECCLQDLADAILICGSGRVPRQSMYSER
jgi:hypothetical protein